MRPAPPESNAMTLDDLLCKPGATCLPSPGPAHVTGRYLACGGNFSTLTRVTDAGSQGRAP